MKKILITGSTDGIGFETAKKLLTLGHKVLIHGRSAEKIENVVNELKELSSAENIGTYTADLSIMKDVERLAKEIEKNEGEIDVLINNAGVYKLSQVKTKEGLDARFVVNTIAPYYLTKLLLPVISKDGRVINLSSAAQASIEIEALLGNKTLDDSEAYAQSKLGLTMWSHKLGLELKEDGPAIIAVNPKSFLGSKMVKDAYGMKGNPLSIGADILSRASLSEEFEDAGGRYFDNDIEKFARPHPDTFESNKVEEVIGVIERILKEIYLIEYKF